MNKEYFHRYESFHKDEVVTPVHIFILAQGGSKFSIIYLILGCCTSQSGAGFKTCDQFMLRRGILQSDTIQEKGQVFTVIVDEDITPSDAPADPPTIMQGPMT